MTSSSPRVRFAPSPTGGLHIGGVRTALYNYLFARKHGGQFILRIEDTDQKRLVAGSEAYIKEVLAWLGITPDEGPDQGGPVGPYRQSERKAGYRAYAEQLVAEGKAYYAFDSNQELADMRVKLAEARIAAPGYNALIRQTMQNALTLPADEVAHRLREGHPHVIRLLVDPHKVVRFRDEVRGWISVKGNTLDDKVLLKADGMPTYHLANVVDDHLMGITHVIRGEEWLPSTPTHVLLYEALDWAPPIFAHLPLLLSPDGKGKLSKRNTKESGIPIFPMQWQDPNTQTRYEGFREEGYLPDALINFLALLGWHPSGDQEYFTHEGLIEAFAIERIHKAGVKVDIKKAQWLSQYHLKVLPDEHLATTYLLPALAKVAIACDKQQAIAICGLLKRHVTFPRQLWEEAYYFFKAPLTFDDTFLAKRWNRTVANYLQQAFAAFHETTLWHADAIQASLQEALQDEKRINKLMPVLRHATTGLTRGPMLMEILVLLGKEEVLQRMHYALTTWHFDVVSTAKARK